MAQTAQTATKPERAKRNSGPMAITFADKNGQKDLKRVPLNVSSLHVAVKGHGSKNYDPAQIPAEVKDSLAILAIAGRMKIFTTNHGEPNGANILALTDQVFADFVGGKVYPRAEREDKPGKKFDPSMIAEAAKSAWKTMETRKMVITKHDAAGKVISKTPIKALSDQTVADLKTKLETSDRKTCEAILASFNKNKFFVKALADLKAKAVDLTDAEGMEMPSF